MAPYSSTLAWKIPWMEEPGRLQSMRSLGVWHDWATSLHFSLSCIGERNGNPLQCSCLENPRDGRAWWAAVSGVAQSWTRLERLRRSSSSSVAIVKLTHVSLPLWAKLFKSSKTWDTVPNLKFGSLTPSAVYHVTFHGIIFYLLFLFSLIKERYWHSAPMSEFSRSSY